ncbi:MAG: glutathione S-transferase family protein [Paracoccaceae bacterium]|nr:glutathione S-transferase family protein [Paracoccaceae bacterium]
MKLFMVGASPFARKVRAVGVQLGLEDRLEIVIFNPHKRPPDLVAQNPLSKVPTLIDDDGRPHIDSYTICEYLATLASDSDLIPQSGEPRRLVLFRHALAHGIMEAAVTRRLESLRAPEPDRLGWIQTQRQTIARTLDWFEADPALDGPLTLDRLTLAAALGFLDFRFPDDGWRAGRPRLTDWQEKTDLSPALDRTRPFD